MSKDYKDIEQMFKSIILVLQVNFGMSTLKTFDTSLFNVLQSMVQQSTDD